MNVLIDMPLYEPAISAIRSIPGVKLDFVEQPVEKVRPLPTELIANCEILFCTFPPENHSANPNVHGNRSATALGL
jgi:hypothetical protein